MSEPRHDDVGGVLEELRAELDRIGEVVGPGGPATLEQLVERISSTRSVSTGHPFTIDRGGGLGPARGLIRRVLRKLVYWYVEPLAVDVRAFADAATSFAAASAARAADGDARHADLERFVAALRDRVGRAERALADRPPPQTRTEAAADPRRTPTPRPDDAPAHAFDYFAFEALMRGSREEISARQQGYLTEFASADDILDVGCGRGEFLVLLRDAGKRATGIDIDADMVAQCRDEGLDVVRAEAVEHLSGLASESLGGIFAAQVVEHLQPAELVAFLAAARAALAPGGVIVLETINPASLCALRNYFADLTHAQPLVPETLSFLVESAGFTGPRIAYTSPVPDRGRLIDVPFGDAIPAEALAASRRNIELLNGLLFAPQDYAVIAGG